MKKDDLADISIVTLKAWASVSYALKASDAKKVNTLKYLFCCV